MPNWCECDLTVSGSIEDVAAFVKRARYTVPPYEVELPDGTKHTEGGAEVCLSQEPYLPMPEELTKQPEYGSSELTEERQAELLEKYGAKDGWHWQCKNWGVKWGICDPEHVEDHAYDGQCESKYTFKTPWGPPDPILAAMSKAHPTLEFELRYFEAGAGFNGRAVWKGGEPVSRAEGEYFGNRGG